MTMPIEKFAAPETLDGALEILNEYGPDTLILAGGTMVMPLINEALTSPRVVLSLQRTGLDRVSVNGNVEIGATTTLSRVSQLSELPLLAGATHKIGSWAIRNMATLAGNLFAPPPAGDAAVALLALDAKVVAAIQVVSVRSDLIRSTADSCKRISTQMNWSRVL